MVPVPDLNLSMPAMSQSGLTAGFGDVVNSVKNAVTGGGALPPWVLPSVVAGLALAWFGSRKGGR